MFTRKGRVEHTFGSFPRDHMNPNGGSVPLGHPPSRGPSARAFRVRPSKELAAMPQGSRAIVSICADSSLGTVAILEN